MTMKSYVFKSFGFLALAAGLTLFAHQGALAADNGWKTIRGTMSAGGTASGFTLIMADNGEVLQVPNMSGAALKIKEKCDRDQECEVVYSIDRKKRVKVHSVKLVGR
ncbi:MAG: hypothetical protein LUG19_07385 [Desulfovibrio sp.]|uniref:hypothetical protein n=1 Tax=Desulfovibrio sp. TaxID=885 RepID=UPI00258E3708|nr:hypothetical protein [Desulfovibrio sp.]MCD7984060.1 hypothetical protein [Desulfovibrio sp.]